MIEFQEHRQLKIENVISYREYVKQTENMSVYTKLLEFVQKHKINIKKQCSISVIHKSSIENGITFMDTELLWMVDQPVISEEGVRYIKTFQIDNALRGVFQGSQEDLKKVDAEIAEYVSSHHLIPQTPCYMFILTDDGEKAIPEINFYMGIRE